MSSTPEAATLTHRAVRSDDALFQDVGGEAVLLDLASERYFGLDPVGTRIWTLLGDDDRLQSVHETLCAEYEADPDRIAADLWYWSTSSPKPGWLPSTEMRRNLRGWFALSWPDRGRVLGMMLLGLPAIHTALRLFGFGRTRAWLERRTPNPGPRKASAAELEAATSLARLAAIAGRRGPVNATCLRQSLLVYCLLRRRGLAPKLKIGVKRNQGAVDAHAWVELEGVALPPGPLAHQPF